MHVEVERVIVYPTHPIFVREGISREEVRPVGEKSDMTC